MTPNPVVVCRNNNCAPVCPHITIKPDINQLDKLYKAVNYQYEQGALSKEDKEDLVNMLTRGG